MATTWGDISDQIKDRVNDPNNIFFTDEYLMKNFNFVTLEFAVETESLLDEEDLSIMSDGRTVALPKYFLGIKACGIVNSDDTITPMQASNFMGRTNMSQDNTGYYLVPRNGELILTKTVDDDLKVKLKYYRKPKVLELETDTGWITDIEDEDIETIVNGVAIRCFKKRKFYDDALVATQDYQSGVAKTKEFLDARQGVKSMTILRR